MGKTTIDRLIINSPYEEPQRYWRYDRETRTFDLVEGRRPAGYVVATPGSKAFDDPGIFIEISLVNQIRPRVKTWREAGYPGVSSITKRLLEHWRDPETFDARRFFFCQLEAVETLIWLTEAPAAERVGIEIPGDGGAFARQCCKMATGTGKSYVIYGIARIMLAEGAVDRVLVLCPSRTIEDGLLRKFRDLSADGTLRDLLPQTARVLNPQIINGTESIVDGTICVENFHATLEHVKSAIHSLALSRDGRLLACGDEAGRVWIFDWVQ